MARLDGHWMVSFCCLGMVAEKSRIGFPIRRRGCWLGVCGLLADLHAVESGEGGVASEEFFDFLGGVHDEGLLEEGDFGEEFFHAAFDHFLGDLFGLARFDCLFDAELAFFFDEFGGDVVGGEAEGARHGSGDMHGDLLHDFVGSFAGCLDEYACFTVVVDILAEGAVALEFLHASDGDVFAGGDAEVIEDGLHIVGGFSGACEGEFCDLLGDFDELVIFCGEVCFCFEFDDGGGVTFDGDGDASFAGDSVCFAFHFSFEFFAEEVLCFFDIAICFDEGFFAFHHGESGLVSESHDIFGTDVCHCIFSACCGIVCGPVPCVGLGVILLGFCRSGCRVCGGCCGFGGLF